METSSSHIGQFTRLPVTEVVLGDKIGRALHIQTPHKGEVVIEYYHQSFFREKHRPVDKVLNQIRELEYEAREFLFGKWLNNYYNPPITNL